MAQIGQPSAAFSSHDVWEHLPSGSIGTLLCDWLDPEGVNLAFVRLVFN